MKHGANSPKATKPQSGKVPLDGEALANLTGFFALLSEIDEQNKAQSSKD